MKTERIIHKGFTEFEEAKGMGHKIPQYFGKYQYIYSSKKGKISLIFLKKYYNCWEIYCLEGDIFEDCERFPTKKEAEKRIKELLNEK